eukprot:GILJ01011137.1.p1 GENE.GILJ01011137.1~~GILJ01011137.1.p1  ORF type:complete len:802 (+),score=102.18 GILJ01011137.1:95-2500(+)
MATRIMSYLRAQRPNGLKFDMSHARPSQRHNFLITDLYNSFDEVETIPSLNVERADVSRTFLGRMRDIIHTIQPLSWVFLVCLGVCSSLITISIDYVELFMHNARRDFANGHNGLVSLCIWMASSVVLATCAGACGQYISKAAEGSGIPELKAILSGVVMPKYLVLRTFVAKVLGLVCGLGSGISIGKEGPFVHIGAILANQMSKLSLFKHVEKSLSLYRQMLAAGVAAGVASAFGSPIGGVLFSIEVTSSYYMVSNMWKAFFCCVWCGASFALLHKVGSTEYFLPTDFKAIGFSAELMSFAFLGILCGIIGSLFVHVLSNVIMWRKTTSLSMIKHRFKYLWFIACFTSFFTFAISLLHETDVATVNEMFSSKTFEDRGLDKWTGGLGVYIKLLFYLFMKIIFSALAMAAPIPCGTFIPIFTMGAVLGRFWGELLGVVFTVSVPGVYAVAGAAGIIASSARTISITVIVFEMTGQLNHLLAILITVLLAYSIGSAVSVSIYDMLLDVKGLPYLPALQTSSLYSRDASDIMSTNLFPLVMNCSQKDAEKVLEQSPFFYIPLVDNASNMNFVGAVLRSRLESYLLTRRRKMEEQFEQIHGVSSPAGPPTNHHRLSVLKRLWNVRKKREGYELSSSVEEAEMMAREDQDDVQDEDTEVADVFVDINHFVHGNEVITSPAASPTVGHASPVSIETLRLRMLESPIDLSPHSPLHIDMAPFQVTPNTPLSKVHYLFTMLGLAQVFITKAGYLVGIVTKDDMLKAHHSIAEQQTTTRPVSATTSLPGPARSPHQLTPPSHDLLIPAE